MGCSLPGGYDQTPPYLEAPSDPMDADGFVTVPTAPGLGYRLDWDYIEEHRLPDAGLAAVYPRRHALNAGT